MSNNDGINQAWKPFLDVLPESLHGLVIPVLRDWDKGVQEKFQDIRNEYAELEPFKKFVEANVDPEYVEQAVIFADQLQQDPTKTVGQINEAWGLGFLSKAEAEKLGQSVSPDGDGNGDFVVDPDSDIFKDPRVKAMQEALDKLQNDFQSDREREEEAAALEQFESDLNSIESKYTDPNREGGPLPFNRLFVTALMTQGMDGDAAVAEYHKALAGQITAPPPANTPSGETPPVVMGSEGTAGSGTSSDAVQFGSLSKNDLNSTVEQLLQRSMEAGQ